MRPPLITLALTFCAGIFCGHYTKATFLPAYSFAWVFLLLTVLSLRSIKMFNIFLLALIFLWGMASLGNSRVLPRCHIRNYVFYKDNRPYRVRGFIISQPVFKYNRTSFVFAIEEILCDSFEAKSCGKILVYIDGRYQWRYGEALALYGRLYRPFSQKGYRGYLTSQGIYFIMQIKTRECVSVLNQKRLWRLKGFPLYLKDKIEGIIFRHLSSLPASILDAMLLGEKKYIPPYITDAMVKSGTVHILVVSGFNVGIVTYVMLLLLKLTRLPKIYRFFITACSLVSYCLITGASTPVVRATVMALVFVAAYWFRREPDLYHSCALAAMFILVINPRQLFDIGFQLSFSSVISIIYFTERIKRMLHLDSLSQPALKFITNSLLVSFSAWLGTMLLVAHYFKIFSPITVLANLFIASLATLITLLGFALVITGLALPPLAPSIAATAELAIALLLRINALLVQLPAAYFYLH